MSEATIRYGGNDYPVLRWIRGRPCNCLPTQHDRCVQRVARCTLGMFAILNSESALKKKASQP